MLTFSPDPDKAEQEMHAIIFYLTTFGYIDGDFDATEKSFVRAYIRKLVVHRAETAMADADPAFRSEIIEKFTAHFHEVFEGIDSRIQELFAEPVQKDEDPSAFVHTKLKVRCFEIFQSFDRAGQEQLMATIDELLLADGHAHPAELKFRAELAALLSTEVDLELVDDEDAVAHVRVEPPRRYAATGENHPFFVPAEFHYSADRKKILEQAGRDRDLIDRVLGILEKQRAHGKGKLAGKTNVGEIPSGESFLDGFTYVTRPVPKRAYELIVLGDLHGCYSVLKATLIQSRFFEKVTAFQRDPTSVPEPKLVLLGDYIDRGLFSLNGVLRTVLQLFATAPDHVVALRGNHEYYVEYNGNVYGGVKPAESINTLKPHLPLDVFRHYAHLFERLPNTLLFDRFVFVHGGIPRDRLLKERWRDLSSLNDVELRFQMMWSDPSRVDVVPAELQEKSARFPFGKLQLRAFLQRMGCHTLVRGHEKVNAGFERTYDDEHAQLFTLFSAGGRDNNDLPLDSSYRSVTPMALTLLLDPDGNGTITPWAPDYRAYNDPQRNGFFQAPPEIAHRRD
ncbi:metallophosphoesterase family protein [Pendulispora albinea]|uniref:Serine/threonine protein phosphatase n=1 Tax=Pendulispora albinea TaxID=2741071 RepID=A0ABZ2LV30_9BACT